MMEKLLKQIYYLHRKEIKKLESKIELLNKENVAIRVGQNCCRCLELEIALQKKTEEYLKLQQSKGDCEDKSWKDGKSCSSFKKVVDKDIRGLKNEDENFSDAGIPENEVKNVRRLSMFDDISPIRPSQDFNQINEFSPVPETPLLLMKTFKSFNYSSGLENPSTVISETLDEGSIYFSKSKSLENVENPISVNVAQVTSSDETNNADSVDFIESSFSPEVVMLSPVFSSQDTEVKPQTSKANELNASLDDFEIPKLFKRRREDDVSQKATKLKITNTKIAGFKRSASTTNAKYSFIPAGKGYRKPKYKQTTLSQTFGDRRNNKISGLKPISEGYNINKIKDSSQNDIDCTFIPTQFLPNESIKKQMTDKLEFEEIFSINCPEIDDSDTNSSEDLLASFSDTIKQKEDRTQKSNQNSHKGTKLMAKREPFFEDFDVIPKSPNVNYKYMRDAVKKKDERNKLDGQQCLECEKYYNGLGLSELEKKQRLNECSRHRNNFSRPKTPEHFWSPEFPTTQECKRRGMLEQTQDETKGDIRTRRPKK